MKEANENKTWLLHATMMVVVALVALVSVTAMVLNNQGKSAEAHANAPGWQREFGSLCSQDAQCASGNCGGEITLKNGNTIPGVHVCI